MVKLREQSTTPAETSTVPEFIGRFLANGFADLGPRSLDRLMELEEILRDSEKDKFSEDLIRFWSEALVTSEAKEIFIRSSAESVDYFSWLGEYHSLLSHITNPKQRQEVLDRLAPLVTELLKNPDRDGQSELPLRLMICSQIALFEEVAELVPADQIGRFIAGLETRGRSNLNGINYLLFRVICSHTDQSTKVKQFLRELKGLLPQFICHYKAEELPLLLERPELIAPAKKHLARFGHPGDQIPAVHEVLQALGFSRTSTTELNEHLLKLYADSQVKKGEEYLRPAYRQAVRNLPPADKFVIISHQRQNHPSGHLQALRFSIDAQSQGERETDRQNELAYQRARVFEHPLHPLNTTGLSVRSGYEIEYPQPTTDHEMKQLATLNRALTMVGTKSYLAGGIFNELAPGPFRDSYTGLYLFHRLVDAGVIDPFKERNFSIHFSLGLPCPGFTPPKKFEYLIWGLKMTGWAYNPQKNIEATATLNNEFVTVYDRDELELCYFNHEPEPPNTDYFVQFKAFDFVTTEGFEKTFTLGTHLGWALNAYLEVCSHLVSLLTREQIEALKTSPYTKRLALIWLDYEAALKTGCHRAGIGPILYKRVRIETLKKMDEQIKKVFPRFKSHFSDPREARDGTPIEVEEVEWPNLVIFARDLIEQTSQKVLAVAADFETEVAGKISFILSCHGEEYRELRNALLFELKTIKSSAPVSEETKENFFRELVSLYTHCL